ncbi:uncharacterized protein TNCV_508921 [Trichonephila clavipes]|nr:uncharacterized protein TNCV_508921 [Trichonephila clavipes]
MLPASSVKRLANQRLHLGRNEVSDWLDARHSTFVRLVAQQPVRAKPTVPISVFVTLGTKVHEQMFRSGGQYDTKTPVFSSQAILFQQDGATCHTARAIIDLLKDTFGDGLISRFGPVNWPSRFCDLTPLDYFLWGYVKSLLYADKPQTLDHLEDNIRRGIADTRPRMLEKVIENWTS